MGSSIITIIVVLALVVLFFYMLRSGILWYWKIDVMAKNLEEQTKVMKEQKDILQQMYLLQAAHKGTRAAESKEQIGKSEVV